MMPVLHDMKRHCPQLDAPAWRMNTPPTISITCAPMDGVSRFRHTFSPQRVTHLGPCITRIEGAERAQTRQGGTGATVLPISTPLCMAEAAPGGSASHLVAGILVGTLAL